MYVYCRRSTLIKMHRRTELFITERNVESTHFAGPCPDRLLFTHLPSFVQFVDQELGVSSTDGLVADGTVVSEYAGNQSIRSYT